MGTHRSLRASLWWAANGYKCLPLLNKLDFKLVTWRWKVVDFVIHHPSYTLVWQPGSDSERKGQESDMIPFISDLSHSVTQAPNTAEDRNSMKNSLLCILTDAMVWGEWARCDILQIAMQNICSEYVHLHFPSVFPCQWLSNNGIMMDWVTRSRSPANRLWPLLNSITGLALALAVKMLAE